MTQRTDALAGVCQQADLFVAGAGGYHSYRIPSLVVSKAGTLLAFCEGRLHSRSDTGDIDLLVRRSCDGGRTWGPVQVVWNDGANTCGNPCPVVDQATGTIWLTMTHNLGNDNEQQLVMGQAAGRRTVWVTSSSDDGLSWSVPRAITRTVMPDHWRWYATGPGAGIQTRTGRLVVPCDHKLAGGTHPKGPAVHYSHVIYSDDHGLTWQLGGAAGPGGNECEAIELSDGQLMLNMRSYRGDNRRLVALSSDQGLTWTPAVPDAALIEPVCQASIRRFSTTTQEGGNRILFSNPASTNRERMTVRLSYDESRTWPVAKQLWAGPSAYSCLAVLPDRTIACFYERGDQDAYERLSLALFNLAWLTDGADGC